jgi:hypothetical protein
MSNMKSEKRELNTFNRVSMRGIGRLMIKQGEDQEVILEGGEIAISRITTNVVEGKLVIDVGRDWVEKLSAGFDFLTDQDVTISITVKDLTSLEVAGAADIEVAPLRTGDLELKLIGASNIKVEGFKADRLKAELPGAGKIRVDGEVTDLSVVLAGAGNFSGLHLKSKNAKVVLSGVGSAQLWATDELDVTIAGVGSVEYYGSPAIKQSLTMLGKITSLGEPK